MFALKLNTFKIICAPESMFKNNNKILKDIIIGDKI